MKRTLALSLALFFVSFGRIPAAQTVTDTLSPDTLSRWITQGAPFDFILIDVRDSSTELSVTGVIATAQCHPYNFSYNEGLFQRMIPQLPKQMPTVLYCRTGGRSGICATKLDSAGFTSVYSLRGGFLGWKGPEDSMSIVKPASDLPAPSMLKNPTGTVTWNGARPSHAVLSFRGDRLFVNSMPAAEHTLELFDPAGKLLFRGTNPFSHRTSCPLPGTISKGVYAARLRILGENASSLAIAAR